MSIDENKSTYAKYTVHSLFDDALQVTMGLSGGLLFGLKEL